MKIYAAPMEGITGYIYRNAHARYFPGVDKYFTPFLTPKKGKGWTSRERNDVMWEHNQGIHLVPQILTRQADDFIRMAEQLKDCGYEEVNLNLGCPSGTVVAKGKGCGFLADREELQRFFTQVFSRVQMKVSVKTRLGVDDPEEIIPLMEIYNQFPLEEVIVHARIHKDFYRKPVNRSAFGKGFLLCEHPVCYNGDIYTKEDVKQLQEEFPQVDSVMIGRGMIANPQLPQAVCGMAKEEPDWRRWKDFHDELRSGYEEVMSGERNVLFKMKEIWGYMLPMFGEAEKAGKKIRKAVRLVEYQEVVDALFEEKMEG